MILPFILHNLMLVGTNSLQHSVLVFSRIITSLGLLPGLGL